MAARRRGWIVAPDGQSKTGWSRRIFRRCSALSPPSGAAGSVPSCARPPRG